MQAANDLRLLLSTAISFAMIWILVSSVRILGKQWLVGFISLSWLLSAIYLLPASLLRNNPKTLNAYQEFLGSGEIFLAAADVLTWVLLLTFVLKLQAYDGQSECPARWRGI